NALATERLHYEPLVRSSGALPTEDVSETVRTFANRTSCRVGGNDDVSSKTATSASFSRRCYRGRTIPRTVHGRGRANAIPYEPGSTSTRLTIKRTAFSFRMHRAVSGQIKCRLKLYR